MSVYLDPEALALLFVQQYLSEAGYSTALTALEQASGIKYDDDKPTRGSELMELVYQLVEKRLAEQEAAAQHQPNSSSSSSRQTRQQQIQQQHAKLQEELTLRSAAADYPSFATNTLGPSPANLLSVLMWPGQDIVVTGAADGVVRLVRFGEQQQQQQHAAGDSSGSSNGELWATRLGGAGGVLTLTWHPGLLTGKHSFSAAKNDLNSLLLAGCMDGSVHLLHAGSGRVLASAKPHNKYVVAAAWAPALLSAAEGQQQQQQQGAQQDEQLIATAAYDSSCCLLRLVRTEASDTMQEQLGLELVQQVPFAGYVQDVCFLPPGAAGPTPDHSSSTSSNISSTTIKNGVSSSNTEPVSAAAAAGSVQQGLQLVVAVRGTNCLSRLDVKLLRYAHNLGSNADPAAAAATAAAGSNGNSGSSSSSSSPVWSVTAAGLVNMSEAADSHVSFSAMRLAVSPCNRYLLIATDSPILLVLRLSDWGVVRRLYGMDVDKFHNASVAWHKSSSYVMAGAAHAAVCVYHLGTAKVVAQLRGHTVNVRSIHYDAATNRLATCSFDKTVKVYEQP